MATIANKPATRSAKPRAAKPAAPKPATKAEAKTSPFEQIRARLKSQLDSLRHQVEHQLDGNSSYKRLRSSAQHLQSDANAALSAARKDYERAKKLALGLRDKSAIRAFVQSKFKSVAIGR